MQVKYEMLRRVSIEKAPVTLATEEYGVSRPTYYQTKASFDKGGVARFVPRKRGPRGPHKLQGEARAFVEQQLVAGEPVRARELAKLIQQKFGLAYIPGDRAGRCWKKNSAMTNPKSDTAERSTVVTQYETMRRAALGDALPVEARCGLLLPASGHVGMGARRGQHEFMPAASWSRAIQPEGARGIQNRHLHLCSHGNQDHLPRSNTMNESLKVQAHHIERSAYLYIRQSSMRQVLENVESTKRQYALRSRAVALGWREEQIIVIDNDQGESGASAAWRKGFQQLVTDVGMGHAGIVMGLEVSRLARNNADWHRLLEICALTDTLILDEDGVYDPASFNDRLLLGLKGTMSEAELHVLKAELRGGILNKVRRGEYRCPLPTGFVYDDVGDVVLDPDAQVREAITYFFETFSRVGSASQTVKVFFGRRALFSHPDSASATGLFFGR